MIVNTMKKSYGQNCPVAKTLDLFGDRWTLLIVRELLLGKTKYKEIMDSLPGISPNLLSERLKTLENAKLIKRNVYEEHPRRMEYRLTEKGKGLKFIVGVFIHWGGRHFGRMTTLVHDRCGADLEIKYFCPSCGGPVQEKEVKVVRKCNAGKKGKDGVFKEFRGKTAG